MDNGYIERIKKRKAELKLNNEMLASMTGIPFGTLTKIMAGISDSPRLSYMVALSQALSMSLDELIYGPPEHPNNYALEGDEIDLMEGYRLLDRYGKTMLCTVLLQERKRVDAQRAELQKEQEKQRQAIQAASIKQQIIEETEEAEETKGTGASILHFDRRADALRRKMRQIKLYDLPVSAGTGNYAPDMYYTGTLLPIDASIRSADFAVRVSGNSMQPRYFDGDLLLVSKDSQVADGELGIFSVDGEVYFKKYAQGVLYSLNPAYKPIKLGEFGDSYCYGKVVGRIPRDQIPETEQDD